MKRVDLNCDLGEGIGNEAEIMPLISTCNIACGGHAGDEKSMAEVVELAIKHKVKIGAHPSFPDRENFGREEIEMDENELFSSLVYQVNSLKRIAEEKSIDLNHIKAHGALYNLAAKNEKYAQLICDLAKEFNLPLYAPFKSILDEVASKNGVEIIYETFADRTYNKDASLVSRKKENAVLKDINSIEKHLLLMVNEEKIRCIDDSIIKTKCQTICVHGDNPHSLEILKGINEIFLINGISIR